MPPAADFKPVHFLTWDLPERERLDRWPCAGSAGRLNRAPALAAQRGREARLQQGHPTLLMHQRAFTVDDSYRAKPTPA
jgi:hypothetical protein